MKIKTQIETQHESLLQTQYENLGKYKSDVQYTKRVD